MIEDEEDKRFAEKTLIMRGELGNRITAMSLDGNVSERKSVFTYSPNLVGGDMWWVRKESEEGNKKKFTFAGSIEENKKRELVKHVQEKAAEQDLEIVVWEK